MDQFNEIHGDKPDEPPREWNIQHPEVHFKSCTSAPNTTPVVSDIMGRINHHAVHNGGV